MPGRHADQGDRADRRAGPVRLFHAPPEIPRREQSIVRRCMVAPHALDAFLAFTGARQAARSSSTPRPRRRRRKGLPPALRAGLEPHHAAGAARRSGDHLSAGALSRSRTSSTLVEKMDAHVSATRCSAHLEFVRFDGNDHLLRPAAGALHHRGAARRDHPHPRGQWLPDLQPAPLHAGGRRHEADRRGAARLQARGRPARACSIPAR